jgi:hydroxyacyl-ACP dehydratase HTD2-like protein with hotdog domain
MAMREPHSTARGFHLVTFDTSLAPQSALMLTGQPLYQRPAIESLCMSHAASKENDDGADGHSDTAELSPVFDFKSFHGIIPRS